MAFHNGKNLDADVQEKSRAALQQALYGLSGKWKAVSSLLPDERRRFSEEKIATLDAKIIPFLDADLPLLVAITGAGSTGKSTVFNAIAGEGRSLSKVDYEAGCTRRVLAAIPSKWAHDDEARARIFEQFRANAKPLPLRAEDAMHEKGDPCYVETRALSDQLVLLDTPDFDTGTREGYVNKDAAEEVLRVSDVIVYVVVNQNYNNKDNTDFLRAALTGNGRRKLIVLYRGSRVIEDAVVASHVRTVLENIYPSGTSWDKEFLGAWRIYESDKVVAGEEPPAFRKIRPDQMDFKDLLANLNSWEIRKDVFDSILTSCLEAAESDCAYLGKERKWLDLYRKVVEYRLAYATRKCFEICPARELMRQLSVLWESRQPGFVRSVHKGHRAIGGFCKKVLSKIQSRPLEIIPEPRTENPSLKKEFKELFVDHAREFFRSLKSEDGLLLPPGENSQRRALGGELETFRRENPDAFSKDLAAMRILCPPSIRGRVRRTLSEKEKGAIVGDDVVGALCENIASMESVKDLLRNFVDDERRSMKPWDRAKEFLGAGLSALPLVLGVTFMVATPGSAALSGTAASFLGVNDLYALIAIPSSFCVNEVIRKRLEGYLRKAYEVWGTEKSKPVKGVLKTAVADLVLVPCEQALQVAGTMESFGQMAEDVKSLKQRL